MKHPRDMDKDQGRSVVVAAGLMVGRPEALGAIAEGQHGCFTDQQAAGAGFSRKVRHRRLTDGTWARIGPSTMRAATSPLSWRMRLQAGLLELGPEAVVALRSAAALYGAEGFPEATVDLLVPRALREREIDGIVHSTRSLVPIDRFFVDGFPVTSASRTIIDLARVVTDAQLAQLVDHAVRTGLTSPDFLRRRLEALRGPGRAGVRALDRVLIDTGGHSFL